MAAWEQRALREQFLHWQDRYRADVIFLLFVCWLPQPLRPRHWEQLRTGSRRWHIAVTRRIRALRRRIRQLDWPEGYQNALALELASERLEAAWLAQAAGKAAGPAQRPNLGLRIARLFPDLPAAERSDLLAAIRPLL